jgi:hypothetical protein
MLAVGLLLRLYRLDGQGLWADEGLQYFVASADSLSGVWHRLARTVHPPLSFVINHLFLQLDNSDFGLRLPSVLFGVGSLPLCYAVARRVTAPATAMLTMLVLVISPVHVWHSVVDIADSGARLGFSWMPVPYTFFAYSAGYSLGPSLADLHEERSMAFLLHFLPSIAAVGLLFGTLLIIGIWAVSKQFARSSLLLCLLGLTLPLEDVRAAVTLWRQTAAHEPLFSVSPAGGIRDTVNRYLTAAERPLHTPLGGNQPVVERLHTFFSPSPVAAASVIVVRDWHQRRERAIRQAFPLRHELAFPGVKVLRITSTPG